MEIQPETIKILFKTLADQSEFLATLSADVYALKAVICKVVEGADVALTEQRDLVLDKLRASFAQRNELLYKVLGVVPPKVN